MLRIPTGAREAAVDYPSRAALAYAKDDYSELNWRDVLVPQDRLNNILAILHQASDELIATADRNSIHPSAIAAAIAWEFTINRRGYLTDLLYPNLKQEGWGFGSFHESTMAKVYPKFSKSELDKVRGNLNLAIRAIGTHIGKQRDVYRELSGGLDLSDWPAGLAWLYNTSRKHVEKQAETREKQVSSKQPITLYLMNDMAYWTNNNISKLSWLKPRSAIPPGKITYKKIVTVSPATAREADERYDPSTLFDR